METARNSLRMTEHVFSIMHSLFYITDVQQNVKPDTNLRPMHLTGSHTQRVDYIIQNKEVTAWIFRV